MAIKEAPLVGALSHLRMEWDDGTPPSTEARLLQGARDIPVASKEVVGSFLAGTPPTGSLPDDFERRMLDRMFRSLPLEAKLSWDGIVKFGARKTDAAARCAFEALTLNQACRLARQLLSLVLTKTDVRKPFGANSGDAPDVPAIVAREVPTE